MSPSNTQTKSFLRSSHFLTSKRQHSVECEKTKTTLCTTLYLEINKYISVNTDTHTNKKKKSAPLAILLKQNLRTTFSRRLSKKKNICSYISPLLRSLSSGFIHMVTVCSAISEFMCVRWRNTKSHIQFPTHLTH